jgi:hypothetical protein
MVDAGHGGLLSAGVDGFGGRQRRHHRRLLQARPVGARFAGRPLSACVAGWALGSSRTLFARQTGVSGRPIGTRGTVCPGRTTSTREPTRATRSALPFDGDVTRVRGVCDSAGRTRRPRLPSFALRPCRWRFHKHQQPEGEDERHNTGDAGENTERGQCPSPLVLVTRVIHSATTMYHQPRIQTATSVNVTA